MAKKNRATVAASVVRKDKPGPPMPEPSTNRTEKELRRAAKDVIEALNQLQHTSCFIGGMACHLLCARPPKHPDVKVREVHDLDVFVLSLGADAELLKRQLAESSSKFWLVPSQNPRAKYRVLWYNFPWGKQVKVDILVPGTLDHPMFPPSEIIHIDDLPVAPLSFMLVMKLQAWSQRRASGRQRFIAKIPKDRQDITALLAIAKGENSRIFPPDMGNVEGEITHAYLPRSLIEATKIRLREYGRHYPSLRRDWEYQGFPMELDSQES